MPSTQRVPERRTPRNDSLEGFEIPKPQYLDEATPAGLLLFALTTEQGDPIEKMVDAMRDDLLSFAHLTDHLDDNSMALKTIFDRLQRKLAVIEEIRRRELVARGSK